MEQEQIPHLLEKLNELMRRQDVFKNEIEALRNEIVNLSTPEKEAESAPAPTELPTETPKAKITGAMRVEKEFPATTKPVDTPLREERKHPLMRQNIEKFIGENLINKIGIVILVIGVGIGAKYAIDHDLISPWTRIILGYMVGLGLLAVSFRLYKELKNFSAVLLSGSMAILYFITFAAYTFYSLIPVIPTFALMVLFTLFTVVAAIHYNQQVIAHIGLVGAYAVPFLLSDGSGRVVILFTYMAIINTGILVLAFRKYWKPLYYSSFLLTWIIVISWFIPSYNHDTHFSLAWTFISIFFITFYLIFLAYKLVKREKFGWEDIILLLANAGVFYALGYSLLFQHLKGGDFKGLFTLGNALVHLIAVFIVYRQKEADRNLFYFLIGLVITFFTIAIPVQFDGNWIPAFWSLEATVLFYIGRTRNAAVYELLSYPIMVLAFFSTIFGWEEAYHFFGQLQGSKHILPFLNMNFLTSLLFIGSFSIICLVSTNKQFSSSLNEKRKLLQWANFLIPAMLLIVLYFSFFIEITTFWNQRYLDTMITIDKGLTVALEYRNEDIRQYKTISILAYSLLFFSLLSIANILKVKQGLLALINIAFNAIVTGVFLTVGLFALGALRESYLSAGLSEFFYRGAFQIGIRYVSFLFLALMMIVMYNYIRQGFIDIDFKREFDVFLHVVILTVAGNELINWMNLAHSEDSYKIGLSILFGVYALLLIALGIWKHKLHLRIMAIVLFAATLFKLFLYDLPSLSTISKTIVFVILGILLLLISFLYNKFKHVIFDEERKEE